ncbi:hypothetical protein GWI33_017567 [Rhynchophorus ferrugineus]|uniref:Uncharacterized protein n=1 Tax=Rhynchophorus ferrugineus TaxID=354439 RepID=A0A834HV88_RHYFE|nr:hypothetical protein GWI33_017567 [Rhynchophorus ferrugineus]
MNPRQSVGKRKPPGKILWCTLIQDWSTKKTQEDAAKRAANLHSTAPRLAQLTIRYAQVLTILPIIHHSLVCCHRGGALTRAKIARLDCAAERKRDPRQHTTTGVEMRTVLFSINANQARFGIAERRLHLQADDETRKNNFAGCYWATPGALVEDDDETTTREILQLSISVSSLFFVWFCFLSDENLDYPQAKMGKNIDKPKIGQYLNYLVIDCRPGGGPGRQRRRVSATDAMAGLKAEPAEDFRGGGGVVQGPYARTLGLPT